MTFLAGTKSDFGSYNSTGIDSSDHSSSEAFELLSTSHHFFTWKNLLSWCSSINKTTNSPTLDFICSDWPNKEIIMKDDLHRRLRIAKYIHDSLINFIA